MGKKRSDVATNGDESNSISNLPKFVRCLAVRIEAVRIAAQNRMEEGNALDGEG